MRIRAFESILHAVPETEDGAWLERHTAGGGTFFRKGLAEYSVGHVRIRLGKYLGNRVGRTRLRN